MRKGKRENEQGAIMVEAVIYFPIVICIVVFLLYLTIMHMQEYLLTYEVNRTAKIIAREVAYHGYDSFNMGENNGTDFESIPDAGEVTNYFESYSEGVSDIYREVGGLLQAVGIGSVDTGEYQSELADLVSAYTLISAGNITEPEIEIDRGFFGTGITVTMTHSIPVPGVFRYLGYDNGIQIKGKTYTYAVNPSGFVRNVDLAVDLTSYIFEKLGLSGQFNEFKNKTSEVLNMIL